MPNLVPPSGNTTSNLGTTSQPWAGVVISGALADASGNSAAPAALAAHLASTSNPHSVTAAQAGAVAATAVGAASGVAPLGSDGKVSIAYMPDILQHYLGYYAALSALQSAHATATAGDYATVAVSGGNDKIYVWDEGQTSWVDPGGSGGAVASVNGQTGVVVLDVEDIGAAAASHMHGESEITSLATDLAAKAPLASPAFTGTPAAPTAATGTATTQIATTAFVAAAVVGLFDLDSVMAYA